MLLYCSGFEKLLLTKLLEDKAQELWKLKFAAWKGMTKKKKRTMGKWGIDGSKTSVWYSKVVVLV